MNTASPSAGEFRLPLPSRLDRATIATGIIGKLDLRDQVATAKSARPPGIKSHRAFRMALGPSGSLDELRATVAELGLTTVCIHPSTRAIDVVSKGVQISRFRRAVLDFQTGHNQSANSSRDPRLVKGTEIFECIDLARTRSLGVSDRISQQLAKHIGRDGSKIEKDRRYRVDVELCTGSSKQQTRADRHEFCKFAQRSLADIENQVLSKGDGDPVGRVRLLVTGHRLCEILQLAIVGEIDLAPAPVRAPPTISPPANVKGVAEPQAKVLVSGFDTLLLAMDVQWRNREFLDRLARLKTQARRDHSPAAGTVDLRDGTESWPFRVHPYGTKGYEWILESHDFTLKIGNWLKPTNRPSVMLAIRSQALWEHGPKKVVARVLSLLGLVGATLKRTKISRADLCVDLLVPSTIWTADLRDNAIKYATHNCPHYGHDRLTGFSFGRGNVSGRVYDKAYEIESKSHKDWMYDVWAIDTVPAGMKIVRVEFQLRREAIRQFQIDTLEELITRSGNMWKYCTVVWLKFQHNAKRHHTLQRTMDWWKAVQTGCPAQIEMSGIAQVEMSAF